MSVCQDRERERERDHVLFSWGSTAAKHINMHPKCNSNVLERIHTDPYQQPEAN